MRKAEFDLSGAKAIGVMRNDIVPRAFQTIWNSLRMSAMTIQTKWAARESMLHLGGKNRIILKQEGPRAATDMEIEDLGPVPPLRVGRILYFHREPSVLRGVQRDYSPEFQRELCELAIFYGIELPLYRISEDSQILQ